MEKEVELEVVHTFIVMIKTIQGNRDRALIDSTDADKILNGEIDIGKLSKDEILGDAISQAKEVKDRRDDVQRQKEKLDKELEEKKAMMEAILEQTTSSANFREDSDW